MSKDDRMFGIYSPEDVNLFLNHLSELKNSKFCCPTCSNDKAFAVTRSESEAYHLLLNCEQCGYSMKFDRHIVGDILDIVEKKDI